MSEENKFLPKITTKNWWLIRKKLKITMPKSITKSFVAAALNIKEISAQTNVVTPMKQMGLIDENGSPTQLANEWRNDESYAAACKKIRQNIYPQELLDLAPDSTTEKTVIQNWISNHLMIGNEAARQSTTVYMLLSEADASKESESAPPQSHKTKTNTKKKVIKPSYRKDQNEYQSKQEVKNIKTHLDQNLNINIQIHISADSNAEQIDKIFHSMAKHLKSMSEA